MSENGANKGEGGERGSEGVGGGGGRVQDGEKEAMLSWARCLYHYVPGKGGGRGGRGGQGGGQEGGRGIIRETPSRGE